MSDTSMKSKTPKQRVVESMNRPFETVPKSMRGSPLQRKSTAECGHETAYKSDKYPTAGPTWVCTDCHKITPYPEDLAD